MKLGEGVEVAIHCAAGLAGLAEGATMPAAALARYNGVSASYLLKHLAKLVEAGIFRSVPGPLGGYCLAKPPEAITLADIVLAIEGRQPAFRCNDIRRAAPMPLPDDAYLMPCGIKVAMLKAEKAYRAALAEVRLSDIMTDYVTNADPRIVARGCAFIEANQRRRISPDR
jgi:Rrf2 family protein